MDMNLRKELRDFICWQIENNLVDGLTIDYEMAETYLDKKEVKNLNLSNINNSEDFSICGNCNKRTIYIYFPETLENKCMHCSAPRPLINY